MKKNNDFTWKPFLLGVLSVALVFGIWQAGKYGINKINAFVTARDYQKVKECISFTTDCKGFEVVNSQLPLIGGNPIINSTGNGYVTWADLGCPITGCYAYREVKVKKNVSNGTIEANQTLINQLLAQVLPKANNGNTTLTVNATD